MPASHRFNRSCRSEDGFTLLEILVVICIIGGLAAVVALPKAFSQDSRAHLVELQATVSDAVTSTSRALPLPQGTTEADIDMPLIGKHTRLELHRVSAINYCISVWDASLTEGAGSSANPLTYESSAGGCSSVGVTGTPFDRV